MTSQFEDTLKNWVKRYQDNISKSSAVTILGRVTGINGILVECRMPNARIGDLCTLYSSSRGEVLAEVVGFNRNTVLLSALDSLDGIEADSLVTPLKKPHRIAVSKDLPGSVLDGFGRKMQGTDAFSLADQDSAFPVIRDAISPTRKPPVKNSLATGVRAIDGFLSLGEGQRMGIFAGAGCGKTTLISEIARNVSSDVIVFGLIGERGRELREFLDHELDEELKSKSILVCSTSDRSSMERVRAAATATAIAEAYRAEGKKVLLLIDSLTRFARAQREIGLAAGEPPGRGGFPPSVYTMLPKLVERAGNSDEGGSITALYTVLIEGDDIAGDPVSDEIRSLLDGHIILSRKLAEKNHYPAIDILGSISRTMSNTTDKAQQQSAGTLRKLLAGYQEVEMLLRLGEYKKGSDAFTDSAIHLNPEIIRFLQQENRAPGEFSETAAQMKKIASGAQA